MKKIFNFFIIVLFIYNCSDGDIIEPKLTFLEKYSSTLWTLNEQDNYLRFVNDLNHPYESWKDQTCCFGYEIENLDFEDGTQLPHEVSINSEDLLEVSYYSYWDGNAYHEVEKLTFSVSDNILKMESKFYEDGELQNVGEPFFFLMSNIDVESLILCDIEENLNNTFLETYNGVVLGGFNTDSNGDYLYLRFIKNTNYPVEFWFEEGFGGHSCWIYTMACSDNGYILVENSPTKLELRHTEIISGTEHIQVFTIDIIYDNIQNQNRFYATIKWFENGNLVQERNQYYNPVDTLVDELNLCV